MNVIRNLEDLNYVYSSLNTFTRFWEVNLEKSLVGTNKFHDTISKFDMYVENEFKVSKIEEMNLE